MDYYILTADGQQAGPYSLDQLRSFWANGQVTLDTRYWTEGMADWQPIRAIENSLRPLPPVPKKPPPVPSPVYIPRLDQPKTQRSGCSRFLMGCLIIMAIPVVAIIMFCGVVGSQVASDSSATPKSSGGGGDSVSPSASIYNAPTEGQAIQEAQKFVVGTWSDTPENLFWNKWVIQEDGTAIAYTANESDSGWGDPKTYDWSVAKRTYTDTGEVYYQFHATGRTLEDGALDAIIEKDGSLSALSRYDSSEYAKLQRGDNAHFKGN